MKPILEAHKLSKRYSIRHLPGGYLSLRESMKNLWKFRRNTTEEFWALKYIDFQLKQGECLGIVGRNGAGKSTLLKVLSRIIRPTEGRIVSRGRIASLLEVGTGFHPELTGRENVFFNGSLLGMKRKEILAKFDRIVDFSGTEKFLDTPLKHFSSGMQLRLAFSVAAFLDAEILVIDEVLAVGDAEFQKKCVGKVEEVSKEGRTVLFVSHNLAAVETLCSTAMLLEKGSVIQSGPVGEVIRKYQSFYMSQNSLTWTRQIIGKETVYFKEIRAEVVGEQPSLKLHLSCQLVSASQHPEVFLAFEVSNSMGITILQTIPVANPFLGYDAATREIKVEIELPALIPDQYRISAWMGPHNMETLCWEKEVLGFEVTGSPTPGRSFPHSHQHGFLVADSRIVS